MLLIQALHRRAALAASVALLASAAAAPAAQALPEIPGKIKVLEEKQIDPNTWDLLVESPYVDSVLKRKKVRLMLPAGWSGRTNWPVAWGFHGGTDDHTSWWATDKGNLKTEAPKTQAMWVLPETSWCSAYSDWKDGSQKWETYFFDALRPLIRQYYRGGGKEAAFGASMGGLGATKFASKKWNGAYAFKAVATFSGNVDPLHHWANDGSVDQPGLGCASDPKRVWGDPNVPADRLIWERNDPWTQAPNLAAGGTKVYISAGTKQGDLIEAAVLKQAREYRTRVTGTGTTPTYFEQPNGGHDWANWRGVLYDAWNRVLWPAIKP